MYEYWLYANLITTVRHPLISNLKTSSPENTSLSLYAYIKLADVLRRIKESVGSFLICVQMVGVQRIMYGFKTFSFYANEVLTKLLFTMFLINVIIFKIKTNFLLTNLYMILS